MEYPVQVVEQRWQRFWEERGLFKTNPNPRNKYYVLVMYPYPSGDLHMGHTKNYVIGDCIARYKRLRGYDILHPFGWDAFGLPAENAAILHGIRPDEWVRKNIELSREGLKLMGIAYDWDAEITTCEPEYYRWTQWLFLRFYERGLAYRAEAWVNWCPGCQTVLADEQVIEGRCFRSTCRAVVGRRRMAQWFFKITAYAQRLLDGLEGLDWPESVKAMQRNWIGRSEGCEVDFRLADTHEVLTIYTTRPDTLFGATFLAVAADSPLAERLVEGTPLQAQAAEFVQRVLRRPEIERTALGARKEGIFTHRYAINPANQERLPIWIADYVLASYGTGMVMGVPAHDQRDFEFASQHNLPIRVVIEPPGGLGRLEAAYEEAGSMINSGKFTGLPSDEGGRRIIEWLTEQGLGQKKVNYRLKDWLISRQRYWGAPIPMIHCERCGVVKVPESDLPVRLPQGEVDYLPRGCSPLAGVAEFINTSCPECHGPAKRDPDTMDTFVDSSWYFLRYLDPRNDRMPFTYEATERWLPIDQYIGGIEHACGHLIYFRFFTKVLYDMGLVAVDEPARSLFTQGMVLLNGRVMSSSKGHGIWVNDFVKEHGADTARIAILFAAPPQRDFDWSHEVVKGARRFLDRTYRLYQAYREQVAVREVEPGELTPHERRLYTTLHRTIKRVTKDTERFQFNTAIAALMELLNELSEFPHPTSSVFGNALHTFLILLAPFAPHLAEELWHMAGHEGSIFEERWLSWDESALLEEKVTIPIEVNGRLRSRLEVPLDTPEEELLAQALADPKVKRYTESKEVRRVIYIPNKLLNLVV